MSMDYYFDPDSDTKPIRLPNGAVDTKAESSTSSDEPELTPEESRQVKIQARAIVEAHEEIERRKTNLAHQAVTEEFIHEEPLSTETYDYKYFPTKVFESVLRPFAVMFLFIAVSALAGRVFEDSGTSYSPGVLVLVAFFFLASLWWLVREFVKGLRSGIRAENGTVEFYEPRVLWLWLLGNGAKFSTSQIAINRYYGSFLNFIPGWDSWTFYMDTPAKGDEIKLEIVKSMRQGELFASIIMPDMRPEKRRIKILKRR